MVPGSCFSEFSRNCPRGVGAMKGRNLAQRRAVRAFAGREINGKVGYGVEVIGNDFVSNHPNDVNHVAR